MLSRRNQLRQAWSRHKAGKTGPGGYADEIVMAEVPAANSVTNSSVTNSITIATHCYSCYHMHVHVIR